MKTFEIILFYPGCEPDERAPFRISRRSLAELAIELDNLGASICSITDITLDLPEDKFFNNRIPAEFLCA